MILLGQLKEVDVNSALNSMGGYVHIYQKIVHIFLSEYDEKLQKINESISNNRFDDARILVHQYKGISQNIGSNKLLNITTEFELLLIEKDQTLVMEYFILFKEILLQVANDLQNIKF